ncbi:MAG TPA: peptidylprolyl isomerase [Polyangia bacterium]|jgi:FKBP-type peptidyl-prolyl cis-trans isomerase SlyD
MVIADKKVVRIDYTLKNAEGQLLDSSDEGEPLSYLHGAQQIVPGLERELAGLEEGQSKDVVVAPEEGYGLPDPEGVFGVPRAAFPEDAQLAVGQTFVGEDDAGAQVPVRVVEVKDDMIMVDANHPLAGVTLYFHVEVREVRDATSDELAHAHAHGAGHEHDHG